MSTLRTHLSDDELHIALIRKDQGAVEVLYNKYSSVLNGIISMVLTSQEARLDVLENVFIKIWRDIDQFDKTDGSLFIWMINIAHKCAIDKYRSVSLISENYSVDTLFKDQLMNILYPEQFKIFESIYLKGYTAEETSQTILLPVEDVKRIFRYAVREIRIYFNTKELTNH